MCCLLGNGCSSTSVLYGDPSYHMDLKFGGHQMHLVNLERVQRRASKYVLSVELGLLPLVTYLEYLDISFLLRCLKDAGSDSFNINSFVSFATQSTRAASHYKLSHSAPLSTLSSRFYFHRLPHLWNMLPTFDLSLSSTTLCIRLKKFGFIFWSIPTATIHVPITLCALVTSVCLVYQLLICRIYMISVCLVLFIHLLWHVTHVWLHVLQVLSVSISLSFFVSAPECRDFVLALVRRRRPH